MVLDLVGKEIVRYPEGTKVCIKDIGTGVIRGLAFEGPVMMWIVEITETESKLSYPYSCAVFQHTLLTAL